MKSRLITVMTYTAESLSYVCREAAGCWNAVSNFKVNWIFPHIEESVDVSTYSWGLHHISNPNEEETWIIQTHASLHIVSPASEALSIARGHTVASHCVWLGRKWWTVLGLSHQSRQQLGRVWQLGLNPALQREPETQFPLRRPSNYPSHTRQRIHTHLHSSGSHRDLITDPNLSWSEQRPLAV